MDHFGISIGRDQLISFATITDKANGRSYELDQGSISFELNGEFCKPLSVETWEELRSRFGELTPLVEVSFERISLLGALLKSSQR